MPVLEISDGNGKLAPAAALAMFGAMVHPSDPRERDAFMMSTFFGSGWAELLGHGQTPVPPFVARTLAHAPAANVAIRENFGSPAGSIAGWVLAVALSAEKALPGKGSVRLAAAVTQKFLTKQNVDPDRSKRVKAGELKAFPASEATIDNAWRQYKLAAHLWATMNDWQAAGHGDDLNPQSADGFLRFLARAEFYRAKAQELRPHPHKQALFAHGELWSVPSDIALPAAGIEIAPLKGDLLQAAKEYAAK